MSITNKLLSIPALLGVSVLTYIKTVPFIAIFYFIPALLLTAIINPHLAEFTASFNMLKQIGSIADLQRAAISFTTQPLVVIISVLFFLLYGYNVALSYTLTQGFVDKEQRGIFRSIIRSLLSLPMLIVDCIVYCGIIFMFTGLPLLPAIVFDLPGIVNFVIGLIWFICAAAALFFIVTSMFFMRLAVLKGKGPQQVFTDSAKIVKAYFAKLIVFVIVVSILTWAATLVAQMFMGILFGLAIAIFGLNPDSALLPFTLITKGFIVFFPIVANTVYFINTDAIVNYDRTRMEHYSRVAAINDNTMPSLH